MTTEYALRNAARELIKLIKDVGNETDWRDGDETDRVFAWHEFDQLRKALSEEGILEATAEDLKRFIISEHAKCKKGSSGSRTTVNNGVLIKVTLEPIQSDKTSPA